MQIKEDKLAQWEALKASALLGEAPAAKLMSAEQYLANRGDQQAQAIQCAENVASEIIGAMRYDRPGDDVPMNRVLVKAFRNAGIDDLRAPLGEQVAALLSEYWEQGDMLKDAYQETCRILERTGRYIEPVPGGAITR